jgi:hypothetical protein
MANAYCRQSEAGRGDAGDRCAVLAIDLTTIFDQPCLRAGLFPEVGKNRLFQLLEEAIVIIGELALRGHAL